MHCYAEPVFRSLLHPITECYPPPGCWGHLLTDIYLHAPFIPHSAFQRLHFDYCMAQKGTPEENLARMATGPPREDGAFCPILRSVFFFEAEDSPPPGRGGFKRMGAGRVVWCAKFVRGTDGGWREVRER